MRFIPSVAAVIVALGIGGAAVAAEPVARVSALSSGKLLLDGRPTTLTALDAAFTKLKASRGVVWYYRETAATAEPPAGAMQVIELVIKHQLPISMSTKADFSDAVGADGHSRPRGP